MSRVDVLHLAPPAQLGVLRDRRPRRRHLAATLLDLAGRGHLAVHDSGNDPDVGEALDWLLLPHQVDDDLEPHEQALLDLVGATPSRLLSRVRADAGITAVLRAVQDDARRRGWLRPWPPGLRTAPGRSVVSDLRAARGDLVDHLTPPDTTAALVPQAVALGLGALWTARLGQQRPPAPPWFAPGVAITARGWLGVMDAAAAMSVPPPPGGGAGSAPGGTSGVGVPPW